MAHRPLAGNVATSAVSVAVDRKARWILIAAPFDRLCSLSETRWDSMWKVARRSMILHELRKLTGNSDSGSRV